MNDMQWYKFMSRQAQGFDLPAFRARDEMVMSHSKRPAKIPEQMPVGELKPGWEGETRDQLLAKPDLLTEDIRAHPRKYFKCPGLSKTVESAQAKNRVIPEQLGQPEFAKRKAEGTVHDRHKEPEVAAAVPSPALANFPPALETRPSLAGLGGSYPATTMTWSYIEKAWKTEWSSVLRPGKHAVSSVAPLDFRPAPHAQSGDAISATWSYITRRWKITWADDCSMESSCLGESKKVIYMSFSSMTDVLTFTYTVVQRSRSEAVTRTGAARKSNRSCRRCAACCANNTAITVAAVTGSSSCRISGARRRAS
jgi:hypothetical protein